MRGELIFHVIHIAGTQIIEAGIEGLSRGNNLVGMVRKLYPLHFVPLDQGAVVGLARLEPWVSNWLGEIFISLITKYWFEHKGGNILWATPPAELETLLEILLESSIQQPYKSHVMVVPRLMIFSWRNKMEKEEDFLLTVPVWMTCWGLV